MQNVFRELTNLSPGALAALAAIIAALAGACGAIIAAVIGKLMVTPYLGARDKQDKEAEWRNHAIELTKLDIEAKLKTRDPADLSSIRSPILDFLANYRDLQELEPYRIAGAATAGLTPKELYLRIEADRTDPPAHKEAEWRNHAIELTKLDIEAKLKTRDPADRTPIRSPILDFLANYRDLQELGTKSPAELYLCIQSDRADHPARADHSACP